MSTAQAKNPEAAGSRFHHSMDPLSEPSERAPDSLELSVAERLCFLSYLFHIPMWYLGYVHETFLRIGWHSYGRWE